MAKRSKALIEIEAMKHATLKELDEAQAIVTAVSAKLDVLERLQARIVNEGFRPMKRKVKPPAGKSAAQILDDAAAEAILKRNAGVAAPVA
jgi:L-alanine-DL-glutamate epimerase-like enolase superfamily enzyme